MHSIRGRGNPLRKGKENMTTGLKGRVSLLLLAFAVVMFVFPTVAFAQDAGGSTGAAPTIQSDLADYPPGATVTLTGSNWQPGESVHIFVNDDEGKTWSRDVDVTADDSGNITDQFQLPDWFVATYSVKATGAQSGEATTSFTDAPSVQIQGQSKNSTTWQTSKLTGWSELESIPMRLVLTKGASYEKIRIPFDHFQTSSGSPGVQDLSKWTPGAGVTFGSAELSISGSDKTTWEYTLSNVKVENKTTTDPTLVFRARLAAGAHNFTGASLAVGGPDVGGQQQIQQPNAAPGKPDLAVTKTGPTSAGPGDTITYKLAYQNSSANEATGVELTDRLPSGVTYVAGSCSGSCTVSGSDVVWDLGTLAKSASGSHTLQVSIPANAAFGTEYVNQAIIRSAHDDANATDNTSSLTTKVSFNRAPSAVDDPLTTDEDTAGTVNVLANDTDPDGDTLTVTGNTAPQNGSVTRSGGSFTYTPNANFNGSDSFTYTVSDGKGGTATGTVSVTVNAVNDAPKAADDSYSVDEDGTLTVTATDGVLKNDTDVDNSQLSAVKVAGPTKGTLTLNANGSLTYTPNKDFNGQDSFTYKANDGQVDSNVATVTITVRPVNDAPVAQDDVATTDEDKAIASIPVLSNDSDVDGDGLSVSGYDATSAQGGTVTKNTDGTLRYAPAADFNGSDSFSYTASDGKGGTATAKVTITVNAVNDAPSFTKGADHTSNEDAPAQSVSGWASAISAGPNESGQNVSFVVTNDNNALFSAQPAVASDGTLTYKSDADKNGSATVTVKAKDDGGTPNVPGDDLVSAEQTFTITVRPVNDAPSFKIGDDQTVNEDAAAQTVPGFATAISAGPADESGQNVSFVRTNNTNSALFSAQPEISADGTLAYKPAANANGAATVSFKIQDSGGTDNGGANESAAQSFKITVSAVNDAPVAADDSAQTDEDNAIAGIEVLNNDSDVDGDTLGVSETTQPTNGTVTINDDSKTLKYAPKANFNGSDSFTYTVSDGKGGTSTARVTISVNAVNDAPVAVNDAYSVDEDGKLTIDAPGVLSNDSDVDDANLAVKPVVSGPAHGQLTLNADGSFVYTPEADFNGTDSFSYKASDGKLDSGVATVNITVNAKNDAPVAEADEYAISEDGALTVGEAKGVLSNDSDVDEDSLTATVKSGPAYGKLTLNADGSFSYTPNANYNGTDSFTYTVSDGAGGSADQTVTVTIVAVNDAPVATDDGGTTDEDTPLTIDAKANDSDVDGDALGISDVAQPANGAVTIVDGKLRYVPKDNYNNTADTADTFTYTVSDGNGGTDTATVSITVNAKNDAPVANGQSISTDEDTAKAITLEASDVEGDNLGYTIVDQPSHGTLSGTGANLTYTPATDFNGSDSFTFKANDGQADSNVAIVDVTVSAVNDAPVAVDDTATTEEDTPVKISANELLGNDFAGPADERGQNLTIKSVSNGQNGRAVLNNDGSVTFTPALDFSGEASFDYIVCDDGTPQKCYEGTAKVKVTVSAVNDAPAATPDSETTPEDTTKNIDVLSNDTDVENDALTAVKVSNPANGTVTAGPNGTLAYTPRKDFNGKDSFTYKANDGALDSDAVAVTVTVTPVNDEPQAVYDSYNVDEDKTLTVAAPGVVGNDADVDGDGLTAAQVTGTAHGQLTLNADGSLTYKPNGDYHGPDSFSYKVSDGKLDSNVAMVDITVRPVNDSPVVSSVTSDGTSVDEGSPATIRVAATDPDNPAGDLRYSFDCDNAGGYEKGPQAADNATCTFDDNGTYRVNVEVSDGNGGSATGFTEVVVKNVAPTLTGPISVSPQQALVGQKVTFTAPNPVDPSSKDMASPFNWSWYANDATTPFLTGLGLNPLVSNQFSANKCGTYSVSATATDKDGGVSNAAKADASVSVSNGLFRAPLVDGTANMVQKGQVVPVKVFVGCGTTNLTGLTPSIQLLKGNVSPENESDYTTVTASVSSADTAGFMRPIDGGYIYNLRVPDAAVGTEFTIRVNPFGTTATPNPAGSQMYSLIKVRK